MALPREDGVTALVWLQRAEVAHHCPRPVLARLNTINRQIVNGRVEYFKDKVDY